MFRVGNMIKWNNHSIKSFSKIFHLHLLHLHCNHKRLSLQSYIKSLTFVTLQLCPWYCSISCQKNSAISNKMAFLTGAAILDLGPSSNRFSLCPQISCSSTCYLLGKSRRLTGNQGIVFVFADHTSAVTMTQLALKWSSKAGYSMFWLQR